MLHYDCDEFIEYFDEVYYDSDDDNYMELRSAKYGLNIMYYELNIIDAEEFIKLYETLFKKIKNFAYDEYLEWRYWRLIIKIKNCCVNCNNNNIIK